jgi:hypothetical protein
MRDTDGPGDRSQGDRFRSLGLEQLQRSVDQGAPQIAVVVTVAFGHEARVSEMNRGASFKYARETLPVTHQEMPA